MVFIHMYQTHGYRLFFGSIQVLFACLKKILPVDALWSKEPDKETPLPEGIKISKDWEPKTQDDLKEIIKWFEGIDYRGCIGALIFLMLGTRYDINFAVTKLAKYVNNHGSKHYQCLSHFLRYLRRHPNLALRFYHHYEDSPIYVDLQKIDFGKKNTSQSHFL